MELTYQRRRAFLAAVSALCVWSAVQGQNVLRQWDFTNGNLNASQGGKALQFIGDTQGSTEFGTTESFGISAIGGAVGQVMKFPRTTSEQGYLLPVPKGVSNGGGSLINNWTLVMDLLYPAASSNKKRGLLDVVDATLVDGAGDVEFSISAKNGLAAANNDSGNFEPDVWHRIAIVVDLDHKAINRYIDGLLVGTQALSEDDIDGRWALDSSTGRATLFTDDNNQTRTGFVSSIQLRDRALSGGEVFALSGPSADGIPPEIPPVPSFIDSWLPAGQVAGRDTDIGVAINPGDAKIDLATLKFTVNGEVRKVTPVQEGGLIRIVIARPGFPPGTSQKLEVMFTDDMAGEKTFSHEFAVALFFEDFDELELGPNVDEALAGEKVWTKTAPEGWSIDDSGVPGAGDPDFDGVTEWAGWSFPSKDWWVRAAGDQRRSEYNLASGTVAVADPDEWDDQAHDGGPPDGPWYNTFLSTPPISLEGIAAGTAFLKFASSWRDEFDSNYHQSANIRVSFDGGDPVEVLRWLSDPTSPNFKDDAPNETVLIDLNNPAGAKQMVITFGLFDAGNDWWWALDNIIVNVGNKPPVIAVQPAAVEVNEGGSAVFSVEASGGEPLSFQWSFNGKPIEGATSATLTLEKVSLADAGLYSVTVTNSAGSAESEAAALEVQAALQGVTLYQEDFEGLTLGPNVDEALAGDMVWTKTAPEGWTIDDSGVPGAGFPDFDGVTEWAGWSFANRAWWTNTAGDQRRSEFTKGTGTVAIADGDEWDDLPHDPGSYNSFMSTGPIDISKAEANSVEFRFNSSWRPEPTQTANLTVAFDGGQPIEILRFESDNSSPDFKDDNSTNDTLTISIANPAGAKQMVLTFGYFDAGNNWWWSIDNLVVTGNAPLPPALPIGITGISLGQGALNLSWEGGTGPFLIQRKGAVTDGTWTDVKTVTDRAAAVELSGTAGFVRVLDLAGGPGM